MQKKNKVIFLLSVRISMSFSVHIIHLSHFNSQCDLRITLSNTLFENDAPGNRDVRPCCNLTSFYLHRRGEFNFASLPDDVTGQTHSTVCSWTSFPLCWDLTALPAAASREKTKMTAFTAPPARGMQKKITLSLYVCKAVCGWIHRLSCREYQRKWKLSFDYWK